MLTANVLCLKKKKKRTYCLSSASNCRGYGAGTSKNERSRGGTVTMMQITEDTPPDMLAGAMDLSVHLPNGKTVKMSVERSTPMMDLLVQITTAHHLQLSNHTLQVLGMAPSSEHSDKVLPFKPNTPIGTLDTQHIRILPKGRTLPAPKYQAPGHQPFESTFRLKVHLPRNQLYVTRVSRNVLLEDIMKKVCEEKNLDPLKYEFKHPGNLDEVLDPKLTLSDYQITEIYVVAKGTTNPSQVFSAADIMVLRKEEERKQMHNKTGGGVFNLIFKRGKSSMGSGSISSDNRSISPTHSDDSRSVTPPAVQAPPIVGPPKKDPPPDRPKPPQRKRRPAPKPPQIHVEAEASKSGDCSALVSDEIASSNATSKKAGVAGENCLTICHSRNSSDSSGYHEASILSDHCANASLPRNRPKSAFVGDSVTLQGTSNLNKMALHSRSTTSLVAGRKKKAAPPPPPVAVSPANSVVAHSDKPSPLVASQPDISTPPEVLETAITPLSNPTPVPRPRNKAPKVLPSPRPLSYNSEELRRTPEKDVTILEESVSYSLTNSHARLEFHIGRTQQQNEDYSMEEILTSLEAVKPFIMHIDAPAPQLTSSVANLQKDSKPPEIVGLIPKTPKQDKKFSPNKDSFGKKRCFQIGSSLEQAFDPETVSMRSVESKSSIDDISDLDENMFTGSLSKGFRKKRPEVFNQLFGIHAFDAPMRRDLSVASLRSSGRSIPGQNGAGLRKWNNSEDLDSISVSSYGVRNRWVAGDTSDTESVISPAQTPHDSIPPFPLDSSTPVKQPLQQEEKSLDSTDSGIAQDANSERGGKEEDDFGFHTPLPPPILDDISSDGVVKDPPSDKGIEDGAVPPPPPLTPPPTIAAGIKTVASSLLGTISKPAETETELVDIDWQYQLPSPPKAFRDSSPTNLIANETNSVSDFKDSVVTSPELFEKLRTLEDYPSVKSEAGTSIASEEPLNTLSLEHLEKRQSLVYNRELATSLKMTDNIETSGKTTETFASSLTGFQMDNKASPAPKQPPKPARATVATSNHHTLPNFQITTYDVPKHKNIKVFEDDTIRSNTHGSTTNLETKTEIGSSMENVSYTKRNSVGEEKEYHFYKPKPVQTGYSVSRSGSFSTDSRSSPSKPVSRSKSTLTLNKYHVGKRDENNISRSNSLFDVSGLQSLEVMRLIQNKLNSPPDSTENVSAPVEEKPKAPSPEPVKKYYYRGPPAVNMSTWSERPKVPVAVKEDEDYKLGNTRNLSSKLIVNTTNNNVTSNNSVEVKNGGHAHHVSVNVNGTEQITQKSGNVVIKIGSKNLDNQRFLGPVAYRKPFASINSNGRPHSIAVPSDFDMSRVPVVRSVEFKKSYKDQHGSNTSITHLNQGTDDDFKSLNHYYEKSDSFAEKFRSSENLRSIEKQESEPGKRVFRVGSFKPQENHVSPTVRGFKSNNNDINNRLSWNNNTLPTKPKLERDYTPNQHVPFSQSTLRRTGSNKIYAADQNSNDISKPERIVIPPETNSYNSLPPNFNKPKIVPAPPPPQMPKVTLRKTLIAPSQSNSPSDARGLLLESIKNFGGKKGLKTAKA